MLEIKIKVLENLNNALFGKMDILLKILIFFIVMDYCTGIMKAIINKKLSSEVGFKGIFKKIIILFMVGMATQLDTILNNVGIRYIVITFYLVNEGLSIIENASLIGLKVPNKIKDTLEVLTRKKEK